MGNFPRDQSLQISSSHARKLQDSKKKGCQEQGASPPFSCSSWKRGAGLFRVYMGPLPSYVSIRCTGQRFQWPGILCKGKWASRNVEVNKQKAWRTKWGLSSNQWPKHLETIPELLFLPISGSRREDHTSVVITGIYRTQACSRERGRGRGIERRRGTERMCTQIGWLERRELSFRGGNVGWRERKLEDIKTWEWAGTTVLSPFSLCDCVYSRACLQWAIFQPQSKDNGLDFGWPGATEGLGCRITLELMERGLQRNKANWVVLVLCLRRNKWVGLGKDFRHWAEKQVCYVEIKREVSQEEKCMGLFFMFLTF